MNHEQQRYSQKRHLEMRTGRTTRDMRDYESSGRQLSPTPTTTAGLLKKRRRELPSIRGMANRFSLAIGDSDRIGRFLNFSLILNVGNF